MKKQTIFLILFLIWSIDFILTIIGVRLFGFYETNQIFSYFINKGLVGIMSFFILKLSGTYLLTLLVFKMSYNKYNKSPNLTLSIFIAIWAAYYLAATINNIILLI